nr:VWA domain-containing protein [Endobacter medicaginis]
MISPLARTSVQFALLLPVWALALLGVLTALALGAALWRRTPGAILRAAAACVILLWASGPQMLAETVGKLPQTVLLLTDRTASMSLRQRAAIADATAASLAAELPPDTRLRRVDIPASPTGGTRLFAALESGLADIPAGQLAGVVALTDGQVHDAPAQLPARLGAGAEAG